MTSGVDVTANYRASLGGGTLEYKGKQYKFTIGGLGFGGIGASSLEASGSVHGVPDAATAEALGLGRAFSPARVTTGAWPPATSRSSWVSAPGFRTVRLTTAFSLH